MSLIIISFMLLMPAMTSHAMLPNAPQPTAERGSYIIQFERTVRFPRRAMEQLEQMFRVKADHVYEHALQGFSARMPARLATRLERLPAIKRIEADVRFHIRAQTLPTGVDRIEADQHPIANIDGNDERVPVDIAIIDTGIDLDHPDLNVVEDEHFVTPHRSWMTGNDDNGHGTFVAGVAAALDNGQGVVGVAPGARLWAVKVLDSNGGGALSDILDGIDYAAKHASEIDVANMSFGTVGKIETLRDAIQSLVINGIVVVGAAGNGSRDLYGPDGVFPSDDDDIPASYPVVAAISNVRDDDGQAGGLASSQDDTLASSSNYSQSVVSTQPVTSPGAAIDVAAPGVNILSLWNDGGTATASGTSASAPHVAGAAALYIAEHGRAFSASGTYAIRQALIDTGQPQSAWGPEDTLDPDANPEPLVVLGTHDEPPPPDENTAPTVEIVKPADGSVFAVDESITFEGSADDIEDGDLTSDLLWESNVDGPIGSGATFSMVLSEGDHTITATVTDQDGAQGSTSIAVSVQSADGDGEAPVVTIIEPVRGIYRSASISFEGTATDFEDGSLSSEIEWYSDRDGFLFQGASATVTLSDPVRYTKHIISAVITDSDGNTDVEEVTIYIR